MGAHTAIHIARSYFAVHAARGTWLQQPSASDCRLKAKAEATSPSKSNRRLVQTPLKLAARATDLMGRY